MSKDGIRDGSDRGPRLRLHYVQGSAHRRAHEAGEVIVDPVKQFANDKTSLRLGGTGDSRTTRRRARSLRLQTFRLHPMVDCDRAELPGIGQFFDREVGWTAVSRNKIYSKWE
ncbi:hypothetical protein [Bradyrhizobium genosp. P]|uniref:hypothetical protein n=1 Tax=Bradyrhizobium genosp. P TaxID=83641 RepID=UPI003CFB0299